MRRTRELAATVEEAVACGCAVLGDQSELDDVVGMDGVQDLVESLDHREAQSILEAEVHMVGILVLGQSLLEADHSLYRIDPEDSSHQRKVDEDGLAERRDRRAACPEVDPVVMHSVDDSVSVAHHDDSEIDLCEVAK